VVTHFIVVEDVERSRRFYADVLGGEVVMEGEPSIVALANGWVIINVGGPTEDKPMVTLETPHDPDRMPSFLNIRVADIEGSTPTGARRGPTS
jgi:catechol 2,3-dioxygenase-like lactoylglutathione lyase family enzyme